MIGCNHYTENRSPRPYKRGFLFPRKGRTMKYIFLFLLACLFAGALITLWGMATQQVAITQAQALQTQAGAIDTLAETVQGLADDYSELVHAQTRQMQMQSLFLSLAAVAIGAETMILIAVFALVLIDRRKSKENQVLIQEPHHQVLPPPRPGEYLVMWPFPHYETIERGRYESLR